MECTSVPLGAYTTEKGGETISYPHPLLFVQGPPVFVKVKMVEEESTSVFIINHHTEKETLEVHPSSVNELETVAVGTNSAIRQKIDYLSRPFQKQAYHPLQFIVEGKTVKGDIQKVQDSTIWIELDDEVTEVDIEKIEDVLWRGQSFDQT
ncbi:hypothetical protein QWT69_04745 [Sporosarcina oncorhynchi]|uniref:Uncharacterized protein n=1 Tax=Sporosarcina oncorhynchi TaxID=3056444 RepID=A0ABZ0L792_9BACL|nr:hypothetical protein [Sporosarcina sp. T2O-4]WOV88432.1 hypothetical protein QWT69_04745 [Sporosarcina sp. T2O-4]